MTDKISGNGQVPKIAFEGNTETPKTETFSSSSDKVIDNLDNSHSALVGRSMVKMSKTPKFDGKLTTDIKGDLKKFNENYDLNKKAMLLADAAIAKGMPYDKAVKVAQEFIDMHK